MVVIGFLKNVYYLLKAQILIKLFAQILSHIHLLVAHVSGMKVQKNAKEKEIYMVYVGKI
jgi:hypothetical protein